MPRVRCVILFQYLLHLNNGHQMYFTASNAESWTPVIGAMDLGDLYYRAVDIVQDNADQQWVKDLMKFWKE
jgi:hypothetical protein